MNKYDGVQNEGTMKFTRGKCTIVIGAMRWVRCTRLEIIGVS